MKKLILTLAILLSIKVGSFSQSEEAQQLLLNWEKLIQFKNILNEMYTGYEIVYKGYTTIKDISEGSFDLHKNFLDQLLEISPVVKRYSRIADIIKYQSLIVKGYKATLNRFREDKNFTPGEIEYLGKVYKNLLDQSLQSLDELLLIITEGKLRMTDDERLAGIDRVYGDIVEQFSFLQDFTNGTTLLAIQRDKESKDIGISRKLYNIK